MSAKRTVSLFLAVLMAVSTAIAAAGCDKTPDYSDSNAGMTVELGGTEFSVNTVDKELGGQDVAVYTHSYEPDGKPSAVIGGDHTGRTAVTVRYSETSDDKYIIIAVDSSDGDKSDTLIPVNGFVVSIKSPLLEGLRVRESQPVDVFGFTCDNYERLDLALCVPSDSYYSRRVYYVDPENELESGVIAFFSSDHDTDSVIGDNAVAVILESTGSGNYCVTELRTSGSVEAGTPALVFTGGYNRSYAMSAYSKGDRIYMSKLDNANSNCCVSAITVGGTLYKIGDERTDVSEVTDGVYMFDAGFSSRVVPASDSEFTAIAVNDGVVVSKGDPGERMIIPTSSGYLLVFAGSAASLADSFTVGDTVDEFLISPVNTPDKYVLINGYYYKVSGVNSGSGTVLFTSAAGETTGTSGNVAEIAISDGKVVSVSLSEGNTAVPTGGYVLSFAAKGSDLASAKHVSAGDAAEISLESCVYSADALEITAFNATRYTDNLIIYDEGSSTGTNIYGYEIAVSSDGIMVAASSSGNMKIPDGGYVISGHGIMADALQKLFRAGREAVVNRSGNKLLICSKPLDSYGDTASALKTIKENYEQIKNELYDIDYTFVSSALDTCEALITSADTALNENDPISALRYAAEINVLLSDLEDAMISDTAVENRAVWYRSSVKSDADVLAVIKKCVEYNINAVYLETWYNGKTIGMTDIDLIQHYSEKHGDYDALEGFVRIGHEYGIEIHAWVENFFVGSVGQIESDPEHVANYDKSWILLDKSGLDYYISGSYGDFVFLNPQNEDCRALVLSVYRELLENYDIDGLHLDYIRYPEPNGSDDFGYNTDTIAAFLAEYGYNGDPRTYADGSQAKKDWIAFRQDVITSFVKQVCDLTWEIRPDVWLSAACYPDVWAAPNRIFQNCAAWVRNGYMDEIFSMTYSTFTDFVVSNAADFSSFTDGKCFYSVGLTLFSGNSGDELANQILAVRETKAEGTALFSLGSLIGYKEYENVIENKTFRTKAVSRYLLDITAAAYCADLIDKCDTLYSVYVPEADGIIESVRASLESISKLECGETLAEKKDYCESVVGAIDDILASASSAPENLRKALNRELGAFRDDFSVMIKRIDARS